MRIFIIARGDTSIVFELAEEAFDPIALAIDPGAKGKAVLAAAFGGNICPGLPLPCQVSQGVGVIGLVGQQDGALAHLLQHRFRHAAIMGLPGGQIETDRQSVRIDNSMNFCGQAATGTSHAAIVLIPLFAVAAC